MIYKTENRSNDTTESQEKKICVNVHNGLYSWNKMWSLKSFTILKRDSRTGLDSVQLQVTARLCSDVLFLLF